MSSKPSIRDVARLAGVGVGTVSRVLNQDSRVSDRTREKVLDVIGRLGYSPDLAARALRSRHTNTLGVLLPLFTRHFNVEVLRGIEEALAPTPFSLTIFSLERAGDRANRIEQCASYGQIDGLLIISLSLTEAEAQRFRLTDKPIVLLDSSYPGISSVEVDHQSGAYQAVTYLAALGHERIALVDRAQDPFSTNPVSGRWNGYLRACRDRGLAVDEEYHVMGDYSRSSGQTLAERLLSLPHPPTAIVTGSDLQALGVLEAAKSRGLSVPRDLSIVGYHDIPLAEYVGLTTVRLPLAEMGQMSVEILIDLLAEHSPVPVTRRVTGELVVRGSTGPAPARSRATGQP